MYKIRHELRYYLCTKKTGGILMAKNYSNTNNSNKNANNGSSYANEQSRNKNSNKNSSNSNSSKSKNCGRNAMDAYDESDRY